MNPIGVNPHATIEIRTIDADNRCVVVDDFLSQPQELVEYALAHSGEFEQQDIGYPGVLFDVPDSAMHEVRSFLRRYLRRTFSFLKGGIRLETCLSMATLQPDDLAPLQRLCHSDPRAQADRRNYAGLVYLFDDEALGGTGFYRWKDRDLIVQATAMEAEQPGSSLEILRERLPMYRDAPRYMSGSNDAAELLLEIEARYNRFIFYSGDVPHSAHIPRPDLLSADFSKGRLTLNCFASVRPR